MSERNADAASTFTQDWFERYRRAVMVDHAFDFRTGFFLAYFRSFAVPDSAAILVKTRQIPDQALKRTADTAIIIYEIIWGGFDSDRGAAALAILNRAHSHVIAPNEDFLYVLLSLMIVPGRYIDAHGGSPLSAAERTAALQFYRELGTRMHLKNLPESYEAAEEFYDDFEARKVGPSADIALLFDSTVGVFGARMPAPLRPLVRPIVSALIEDPRMITALGLTPSPRWLARVVFAAVALRRKLPEGKNASFSPGQKLPGLYPRGYTMGDIGPR